MALPHQLCGAQACMDLKESTDVISQLSQDNKNMQSSKQSGSWQDTRKAVRTLKKAQAQLANKLPHHFTFISLKSRENDSSDQVFEGTRLLFLGAMQGQRENTILYVDIPSTHSPSLLDKPVEWKPVSDCFQQGFTTTEKYSKEEELLRERMRLGFHGITSFGVSHDDSTILYPAAGSLFVMDVANIGRMDAVEPREIPTQCEGSRMDPKISPSNPQLISFVHENDIWITHTGSKKEVQLTHVSTGTKAVDKTFSAGVASYVVQEEFDRYTGYWWKPKSGTGRGCILYELVDESDVEILHISNPIGKPDVDAFRYPKAGSSNAKVSLRTVEFSIDSDGQISDVVTKKMPEPLQSIFPWVEYIVRVGWLGGKGVWAQLLDRQQQHTAVVYIPISQFDQVVNPPQDEDVKRSNGSDVEMVDALPVSPPSNSMLSSIRILYEETSDIWINVHDAHYFFGNNLPDEINFIWASERTGHRHLYLFNCNLKKTSPSKRDSTGDLVSGESRNCVSTVTALTSGDWDVSELHDSVWVDEDKELVYFIGLKDTPLETHLYKTSLRTPGSIQRLTHAGFSHTVSMSWTCEQFITVSSSINELYTAKIYNLSPWPIALVNVLEPLAMPPDYTAPELFTFTCQSGDLLYGLYIKPTRMEPGKKYPTVLYVYGGPHVQLVTNSFKGLRYQRLYTLAALGYVVIAIDGHGSAHRGLHFEGRLKHKMGQVEINDQVEGLLHLASQVDFIDLSRVAIHGWSYGGYISLMGLAQRSDIFKVAVAGAPVVCWKHYDTAYTERYMGTPDSDPAAYSAGSVLERASSFPDEPNRLLIAHGLMDENVHFSHTSHLVQALIKHCKPYQLQIYPGERHGIRNPDGNEHFEVAVLSFLQQHL